MPVRDDAKTRFELIDQTLPQCGWICDSVNVVENTVYGLKTVNPNCVVIIDTRTHTVLIALIEDRQSEIMAALAVSKSVEDVR
ncbi:MAG: hypothetical protein LBP22_02890 [Deltaproteobacteria bacterium]|jgi:hypothetical protein|nr:hypothetical protein [Deltaproteobacteria bacterium]